MSFENVRPKIIENQSRYQFITMNLTKRLGYQFKDTIHKKTPFWCYEIIFSIS